jgi:hypothetical protein
MNWDCQEQNDGPYSILDDRIRASKYMAGEEKQQHSIDETSFNLWLEDTNLSEVRKT